MKVVHFGFVPPRGVSNIIYSIEDVTGNVRRDLGDSHVASDEGVVASYSPSAPPPPASSEVEMVEHLALGKWTRLPDLSDNDGSGFARKRVSGSLGRPRCYRRRFFARQFVPCLPLLVPSYSFSSTMKPVLMLTTMAPTILTLNVNGLLDSAKRGGNPRWLRALPTVPDVTPRSLSCLLYTSPSPRDA